MLFGLFVFSTIMALVLGLYVVALRNEKQISENTFKESLTLMEDLYIKRNATLSQAAFHAGVNSLMNHVEEQLLNQSEAPFDFKKEYEKWQQEVVEIEEKANSMAGKTTKTPLFEKKKKEEDVIEEDEDDY